MSHIKITIYQGLILVKILSQSKNQKIIFLIFKEKQIDIKDCFELFRQENILDKGNEWYCSKCKLHVNALKKLEIYKVPKILILHLKRFKGHNINIEKCCQKVVFPLSNLDITDFVLNQKPPLTSLDEQDIELNSEKPIYDLFGVVNHYGDMNSGHYNSYILNDKTKDWYLMDDQIVQLENNQENIISDAAYILFYKKRELI